VSYTVDPGHLARISAVAVVGTDKVNPRVVRRAVGLRAGQPYSRKALSQTQQNLYRIDLFTYASVGLVDSLRSGPDDSMVAISVQVTEGKLNAVRAGAGYGTLDCFRGQAGWTGRNFFGGGRSLDVSGRLSKVAGRSIACPGIRTDDDPERQKLNYEGRVSLHEPFLFTRNTSASFSLFTERHSEYKTFTRITSGAQVAITQLLAPTVPLNFTYDVALGRTIADPAIFCTYLNICQLDDTVFSARQIESTLGLGLALNRANSVLDPSRGAAFSTQVRYSSPLIGADPQRQFAKGVIEFSQYNQIRRSGVFAWRVRLGAVIPAQLSLLGSSQQFVPPDERLYLGGPYSVRGYGQNELGPLVRVLVDIDTTTASPKVDTVTAPTGGDRLVLANAELRWRLFGRLQGALFVDAGQIYGGQPRALDESLRITPGIGLRFTTPLGPLRLDVAYNPSGPTPGPLYQPVGSELRLLDPDFHPPFQDKFFNHLRFHLSVGQAF
jgi:outer membrane protein assembly factor BamA